MMLHLLSITISSIFIEGNGKLGFSHAEISLMKFMKSFYSARRVLTSVVTKVGLGGSVIQQSLLWKTEAD